MLNVIVKCNCHVFVVVMSFKLIFAWHDGKVQICFRKNYIEFLKLQKEMCNNKNRKNK